MCKWIAAMEENGIVCKAQLNQVEKYIQRSLRRSTQMGQNPMFKLTSSKKLENTFSVL
jgi:hypothetical protein